jgi:hypothetical protein
MAEQRGFVPVTLTDRVWRTAGGIEVPWFEVQTDLIPVGEVDGAIDRVMSVYGVSDVVVDAVDQFRKELRAARPAADPAE